VPVHPGCPGKVVVVVVVVVVAAADGQDGSLFVFI